MKDMPMKAAGTSYQQCSPEEATHIMLHLPGPFMNRIIPVITKGNRDKTPCWTWNGDVNKPTLKPSILTKGTKTLTDDEINRVYAGDDIPVTNIICHTFITNGQVQFLNDCTHEFAGMTVDLLDVD